jgi:hypothetical protein
MTWTPSQEYATLQAYDDESNELIPYRTSDWLKAYAWLLNRRVILRVFITLILGLLIELYAHLTPSMLKSSFGRDRARF